MNEAIITFRFVSVFSGVKIRLVSFLVVDSIGEVAVEVGAG